MWEGPFSTKKTSYKQVSFSFQQTGCSFAFNSLDLASRITLGGWDDGVVEGAWLPPPHFPSLV